MMHPLSLVLAFLLLILCAADGAESIILSEFMADNATGLKDEDGEYSDWVEIQNAGTTTVNMAGWALTDDAGDPDKWLFPSVALPPGQFLIVFASGKNRQIAGAPLHANFSLSAAGEYLALIKPGGAIATEYAPQFPEQFRDKSYGIGQNVEVTQLVAPDAGARVLVPGDGASGTSWIQQGFNDGAWTAGAQGVGYETSVPGFAVANHKAAGAVTSLAEAESVLATPSKRGATYVENKGVINYFNTGSEAHYPNNNTFPGFAINVDVDHFVLEATGIVTIPAAGQWTFGVNSDDGFGLTVGGFATSYPSPRGPSDTVATFNFPAAGDYPIRLVFYEQGGGAGVELFAAQGPFGGWTNAFRLVGDSGNGGLAVRSVPTGAGGFRPLIGTDLQAQMSGVNASAYVRIPFTVADVSQLSSLTLKVKYDDGFVAYINGVEVGRRNTPAAVSWNSAATAPRENTQAVVYESMDASAGLAVLQNGSNNVLAIHALNAAASDPDFLMLAELAEFETTGTGEHFFATPSPGQINGAEYFEFVETPQFSAPRGFYTDSFSVAMTTDTPGSTIRYTTNGSRPTATTGTDYTGPIPINGTTVLRAAAFRAGFEPSKVETQTYLFPSQVLQQPAAPPGFPSTWGAGVTADYEMDPNVVNNAAYSGSMVSALKSIPSVSIVMNNDELFGPAGIYSNSTQEGAAWERGASVEWIDPTGNGDEFQIDCGIRVQGGASRSPGNSPKHGFRLLFKSQWGPSKLKFPMFKDSAVAEFDTLVLHGRFNDAWIWGGAGVQYIRDMWCRDTQLEMGRVSPHGNYVHLYVNGLYWGMYDPGEKPDASFAANHLGGEREEYDALNSSEVIDGNRTAWNAMFSIGGSGLTSDAAYAQIQQYLDVPGFIDYMIVNLYAGNTDWPSHNWTAARRRVPGAGFQFFSWDAEWTFSNTGVNVNGVNNGDTPGILYQQLRGNAEFRQLFGDHVQRHFFNGGVLTPAAVDARWMRRAAEIDLAIIAESARWGDYRTEPPYTRNGHWIPEQNRLRSQFFPQRTQVMIDQFKAIGLFPTIAAPQFSAPGGTVVAESGLEMTNPNASGAIIFTTDGSDPRVAGGSISPNAQTYSEPLVLNTHKVVRARVKDGANWSALMEATFYVEQDFTPLAVTEIMFNPPGDGAVSGDEFEFLELKNTGANTLDLSGLAFTGIEFAFSGGTLLAPGEFFVLARNAVKFAERYPGVATRGEYSGRLDNGGEALEIVHVLGARALSVSYDDRAPWPIAADGNGFSLVPISPNGGGDPENAMNWRASTAVLGSPGADDPAVVLPRILVNEVLTHSVAAQTDAIELFNPTGAPVNIGGWFLSDDASAPKKFIIPPNTVIPAGGFLSFTEAQFNSTPGVPPSFSLGADGEQVYLLSGDGTNLTGYSHGIEFGAGAAGVSFGRYVNSIGEEHFPAQTARTFGTTNAGPSIGPVVINEIMYHPEAGYDEFVELRNITGTSVSLFDPAQPANTWRLSGLGYTLPGGLSIPANGFLLVVAIDPAVFRAKYSVPAEVQVVGPYPGVLQDSGERLALQRPDAPAPSGIPFITVDEVRYNDRAPWPASADGDGPSLQRVDSTAYGNDPVNWFASGLTPGVPNVTNQAPTVTLLSPANGATIPGVATIVIEANAQDADGTIGKVEFFNGGTKLGEATAPPYQHTWNGVTAGTYAITAKARDNRQATAVSDPAIVTVTAPPMGNGIGLRGEYYDTMVNFSALGGATPIVMRTDAQVGFDWGTNAPHASMGVDSFSVRWTGQVQPRISGNYGFYTYSDDGVRLWVNNQLVIDNWTDHGPTENAATVALVAGQLYDIRMEFYENSGGAVATLSWSADGLVKELIPQSQLYPSGAPRIARQPLSQSAPAGATLSFTVLASGTAPVTYQWYHGPTALGGQTNATLTLSNVQAPHAGSYSVVATNSWGSATSNAAVLTVTNIDSDGDGIPDDWETANNLNPNSNADASLDDDGDGRSNYNEYLAGSDPWDQQSVFKATVVLDAAQNRFVRFTAMPGKSYTVQYRPSLTSGTWLKLGDVAAGALRIVDTPDPAGSSTGARIYRVVTPLQP